jgi:hypothetical protein
MRILGPFLLLGSLTLAGCSGPYLPEGDAEAGRLAFRQLGCHACHQVLGERFPEPVAQPPIPFALGSPNDPKSRQYLAESIIAPSHRLARPRPKLLSKHPAGRIADQEYENIGEGDESRMGDYNDILTVREWLDLVTFLDAVQKKPFSRE